jgi:hypothetical protein
MLTNVLGLERLIFQGHIRLGREVISVSAAERNSVCDFRVGSSAGNEGKKESMQVGLSGQGIDL